MLLAMEGLCVLVRAIQSALQQELGHRHDAAPRWTRTRYSSGARPLEARTMAPSECARKATYCS